MNIRSNTWFSDNLSWSTVCIELINAFDELGHNTFVVSTNGMNESLFKKKNKMVESVIGLQKFGSGKRQIDLDFTFTVPQNLGSRFLFNSKHKAVIYAFEYLFWPQQWKKFYHLADFFFPPSNFAAEVFINNGVPKAKVFMIPHGVDVEKFNPYITPIKLKTQKAFRFVSVCAPHSRKRLDILLNAYCEAFTIKDDICLVLKTKIYKNSDGEWNAQTNTHGRKGFEIVLGNIFQDLHKKFGKNIPEIEIIDKRVDNVASILNACDVNVSTTGSECGYVPGFESMACGLINIATNYSGHLDYMNKDNSLLIDCKLVPAKAQDQYWGTDSRNKIVQASQTHAAELMIKSYKEYDSLIEKFKPGMDKVVEQYSWKNAAQKIIDVVEGRAQHYIKGTYDWWPT